MNVLLMVAQIGLAFILFWHSANSPERDPILRAMLWVFAFASTCFGASAFLQQFGLPGKAWDWMLTLGHVSLVVFGALWVSREGKRMIGFKEKMS